MSLIGEKMLKLLYTGSKWVAVASLLLLLIALLYKDRLPEPDVYQFEELSDPVQRPTLRTPFTVETADQRYRVKPVFEYELEGVIVSYHDADDFSDIWHHDKWQDFLNVRDLCVIWGDNVANGVYQAMQFDNDSWTCWAYLPDAETADRFNKTQLSNNHLLVDDEMIKRELMSAQTGDHIRISGQLASYENPSNGFLRGTSTRRDDTGNGACETLFVENFQILNKANPGWRKLYAIAQRTLGVSLVLFMILFFITPVTRPFNN
jgi:hypothetical protein